jgi:hypothetical protein
MKSSLSLPATVEADRLIVGKQLLLACAGIGRWKLRALANR